MYLLLLFAFNRPTCLICFAFTGECPECHYPALVHDLYAPISHCMSGMKAAGALTTFTLVFYS